MVIVTATDPDSVSDMVTVTITVTNMDEEGTVTMSSTTPAVGTALTASLTDLDSPDGVVTGTATWQWARSSDGLTGWANIPGAMSASYTPVDPDDVGMYLRAMAMLHRRPRLRQGRHGDDGKRRGRRSASDDPAGPVRHRQQRRASFETGMSSSLAIDEYFLDYDGPSVYYL